MRWKYIVIGNINEVLPSTKPTFAIFDPTTFPIAMVDEFDKTALRLITNSGKDVPNATTVSPITKEDSFNRFAKKTALLTNQSAPKNKNAPPIIR